MIIHVQDQLQVAMFRKCQKFLEIIGEVFSVIQLHVGVDGEDTEFLLEGTVLDNNIRIAIWIVDIDPSESIVLGEISRFSEVFGRSDLTASKARSSDIEYRCFRTGYLDGARRISGTPFFRAKKVLQLCEEEDATKDKSASTKQASYGHKVIQSTNSTHCRMGAKGISLADESNNSRKR
jgi:hypothetical protein